MDFKTSSFQKYALRQTVNRKLQYLALSIGAQNVECNRLEWHCFSDCWCWFAEYLVVWYWTAVLTFKKYLKIITGWVTYTPAFPPKPEECPTHIIQSAKSVKSAHVTELLSITVLTSLSNEHYMPPLESPGNTQSAHPTPLCATAPCNPTLACRLRSAPSPSALSASLMSRIFWLFKFAVS